MGTDCELADQPATSGHALQRSAVRGVVGYQLLANSAGLLVIGIYIRWLVPQREGVVDSGQSLIVFSSYLAVLFLVALPLNAALLKRAVGWVRRGVEPTRQQRSLTLWLPGLEAISSLVMWLIAAIIFVLINERSVRVAFGIGLAGAMVSSILYLLLEGHFRPIFALALRDTRLPDNRRDVFPRLILAWLISSGLPLVAIGMGPVIGDSSFDSSKLPWVALVSALGGAAVMVAAAISVSRPLNRIRADLLAVERGSFDHYRPVDDLGEIGRLTAGVNDLARALRQREKMAETFRRQVGSSDLTELDDESDAFERAGERRHVSVLFVDISGYTSYSETLEPEEIVAMLNRFFRVIVDTVHQSGGWINKFEGDAALAVFGALPKSPVDASVHSTQALRAAREIPLRLEAAEFELDVKIGVASGEVIAGYVGSPDRFEFTVIGDCVNVASRLCSEAPQQRSGILVSARTWDLAGNPPEWKSTGRVGVRGRRDREAVATLKEPTGSRRRRFGVGRN